MEPSPERIAKSRRRLRRFRASVAHLEELECVIPRPTSEQIGGAGNPPEAYWHLVLHASMLRKYTSTKAALYLPAVIQALLDVIVDEQPLQRGHLESAREAMGDASAYNVVQHHIFDLEALSTTEVVDQILNGQILHGDLRRERYFDGGVAHAAYSALMHWTSGVRRRVREVSDFIELSEKQHSIMPLMDTDD